MPHNTPCERCQREGLVRLERIITGTTVALCYYCEACDHSWQLVTPDQHQAVRVTGPSQKDRRQSA